MKIFINLNEVQSRSYIILIFHKIIGVNNMKCVEE